MPNLDVRVNVATRRKLKRLFNFLLEIDFRDIIYLQHYKLYKAKRNILYRVFFVIYLFIQLSPNIIRLRRITTYYILLEKNKKIIGYCLIDYRFDEKNIYLRQIYIKREYRGRKYGKILIRLIKELLRSKIFDAKCIVLHVLRANKRAIKLYEKEGFRRVATSSKSYKYIYCINN